MKLSEATVNVLKNFSTINTGLVFKQGNVLRTMSKQQNVLAKATIPDSFDQDFTIYDLNRFLSLVSTLDSPELAFKDGEKNIKIVSGKSKTTYGLSDESMVVAPPVKDIKIDNAEVNFTLTKDDLAQVLKLAGVLGLPNIAVRGDRSKISLVALNVKDDNSDVFSVEVGTTTAEFQALFVTENFKMVPSDYNVAISFKGISHLKHTTEPFEYWLALEPSSSYSE
jgi:hypothetical protein